MRFKAMVENANPVIRMLQALNQMATNCLLILCRESWRFNVTDKFISNNEPQCYSELPIAFVFSHYMVESKSNNEILLQINIKNLLSAFKSVKEFSGGMTVLKLTKKHGTALLSFEMWQDDFDELRVNLIQDVPVKPIQISKMYLYEEPTIRSGDATSNMPQIKSIKTVIERMKILSQNANKDEATMHIDGDRGKFLIEMINNQCSLRTIYQGLSIQNNDYNHNEIHKPISARISLKSLLKVVQSLTYLQRQSTVIAITKNQAVTIHSRLSDGMNNNNNMNNSLNTDCNTYNDNSSRITYYLCVYVDDEDMDEDEDEYEDDDQEEEKDMELNHDQDQDMQDID